MNVVLINYGDFNSNSGSHVAHFANALARQHIRVAVLGGNSTDSVADFGPPLFDRYHFAQVEHGAPPGLARMLESPNAIIHAWTPREVVRRLTEGLVHTYRCPYVVHLEDNEEVVTSTQTGTPWPVLAARSEAELDGQISRQLSHPTRYKRFLGAAAGVTVIVDRLAEFVPDGVPTYVLEPGVDATLFAPDMPNDERAARRAELFIPPHANVLVYNGNMHAANQREVFSLYTSVMILRRRGHEVTLIRAGRDHCPGLDPSLEYLRGNVITLGYLSRPDMIDILKLADFYVQPGATDMFNTYRLPSKVPEFLALGRPVLLPRANIGLKLRDGLEAVLLNRGDGLDIADKLEALIAAPERATALGVAGRRFAVNHFNWDRSAAQLAAFYRSAMAAPAQSATWQA